MYWLPQHTRLEHWASPVRGSLRERKLDLLVVTLQYICNYKVEDYPKEENKNYILGEYIKPIILKDGKRWEEKKEEKDNESPTLFNAQK